MKKFDLVALGEVLLEFTSSDVAEGTRGSLWRSSWAGDVVNTLFYAGRLGLRTGLVTRFGSDPFTEMIVGGISSEGIDCSLCNVDPDRPNGIYFVTLDAEGERQFHYRRSNSAARQLLADRQAREIVDYISTSEIFYFTGTTLAILRERESFHELLGELAQRDDLQIAFDPNIRPALWESTESMRSEVGRVLPMVDIFLPSIEDLRYLYGDKIDPVQLFPNLGMEHVLMTAGGEGATLYCEGEWYDETGRIDLHQRDTTGAGDGMNAGYLAGILIGMHPREALRQGIRVAENVVGIQGAIDPEFRAVSIREQSDGEPEGAERKR